MSTDTDFAALRYPALASPATEQEFDRARARGHAAGYAAGLRAAETVAAAAAARAETHRAEREAAESAAVSRVIGALETVSARVIAAQNETLAQADAALAAAAIELAEAILCRELDDAPTAARAAIFRALSVAPEGENLAIRVNPADLLTLGADAGVDPGTAPGTDPTPTRRIRFVADAALSSGDAVVDLPSGRIDARISSALARARAILTEGRS